MILLIVAIFIIGYLAIVFERRRRKTRSTARNHKTEIYMLKLQLWFLKEEEKEEKEEDEQKKEELPGIGRHGIIK